MGYVKTEFGLAKPIWEKGSENDMNRSLIFSTFLNGMESAELRLTGSSVYRVFVNRKLAYWGPARSGKGFFRIDVVSLDEFLFEGEQVAIDNIDNVQYESLCGHCYFKYKNNK